MANQDLRVAIYARVSGEQQAKEDTSLISGLVSAQIFRLLLWQ